MTRPLAITSLSRVMECLLPHDVGELVVGDLNEEFALREQSTSRARATWWFVMQAGGAVPRLLVLSVGRWSWFKALGVAVAAYLVMGLVEPYMHRLFSAFVEPGFHVRLVIDLCIGFTACACGGFLATWIHRGSALLYSVIGTGFLATAMTNANPDLPAWFLTAFLVVALVAPIAGGVAFVSFSNRMTNRKR